MNGYHLHEPPSVPNICSFSFTHKNDVLKNFLLFKPFTLPNRSLFVNLNWKKLLFHSWLTMINICLQMVSV